MSDSRRVTAKCGSVANTRHRTFFLSFRTPQLPALGSGRKRSAPYINVVWCLPISLIKQFRNFYSNLSHTAAKRPSHLGAREGQVYDDC